MTLLEMSAVYADSAARLRLRITELQTAAKREADPKIVRSLNQRVEILIPLLREMREMTFITAHYYDR